MGNGSLRQPKIYVPEAEKIKKPFPKYGKILILILVILAGLVYLVFFSSVFKVKSLDLMGNPSEKAQTYLESFIGADVFRLHPSAMADELQVLNPEFANINVSIGIPNILRVKFEKRQSAIVWQTGQNFYLVDNDEIAYQKVDARVDNLILVIDEKAVGLTPPQQIASSNFVDFLKNVKAKITDLGLAVDHYEITETTFQVKAVTSQGLGIIFDSTRSITDQIDALNTVYKDHKDEIKQSIDVRVEGKVYFQ